MAYKARSCRNRGSPFLKSPSSLEGTSPIKNGTVGIWGNLPTCNAKQNNHWVYSSGNSTGSALGGNLNWGTNNDTIYTCASTLNNNIGEAK